MLQKRKANGVYSHSECLCWSIKWLLGNTKKGKLSVITAWLVLPSRVTFRVNGGNCNVLEYVPKTSLIEVWKYKEEYRESFIIFLNILNFINNGMALLQFTPFVSYKLRNFTLQNIQVVIANYCAAKKLQLLLFSQPILATKEGWTFHYYHNSQVFIHLLDFFLADACQINGCKELWEKQSVSSLSEIIN